VTLLNAGLAVYIAGSMSAGSYLLLAFFRSLSPRYSLPVPEALDAIIGVEENYVGEV
jgi:hypothetical protein